MDEGKVRDIFARTGTIAIVGASNDPAKASCRIGRYLKEHGFRILPVNPKDGDVLGEPAYKLLEEIDVPVDMVDVFRPADEAPEIARQAIRIGAKTLWLQSGIESEEARRIAEEGGLQVVMNECTRSLHRRLGLGPGPFARPVGRGGLV